MARNRSTVKRCLAALALHEMLEEEDDRVTKRGKTRQWIKRRGEKEYCCSRKINSNSTNSTKPISSFESGDFTVLGVSTAALPLLFLFAEKSLVLSLESD